VLEAWVPVLAIAFWWYFSERSNSPFFPSLRVILDVFQDTWIFERVRPDLVPSLLRFLAGFALAIVSGVVVGLALGLWSSARRASMPTVDFLRSVPVTTLASAFIIILGFSHSMKIAFIAWAAFFPILLNTIDGVRGVEPAQLDMARAYKLRERDRVFRVILPAASPQIFAGLRVALAVALLVMAFGEMVGGTDGIGFFILFAQETFKIPEMWSGIVLIGILGYLVSLAFVTVERHVLRWHRGWRASMLEGR
jgi:ABC-type nitrate/sulfonate/bicarbonate transport system permease component